MGKKKATKGSPRTGQRSAVRDLSTRRLGTGQADGIKGGLITGTTLPEARRSKNEVAIETLEVRTKDSAAHATLDEAPAPGAGSAPQETDS